MTPDTHWHCTQCGETQPLGSVCECGWVDRTFWTVADAADRGADDGLGDMDVFRMAQISQESQTAMDA